MVLFKKINIMVFNVLLVLMALHLLLFLPIITNSSISLQIFPFLLFIQENLKNLISKIIPDSNINTCEAEKTSTKINIKTSLIDYFGTSPNCLEGKTILITGASKGIGKALARESARLGASNIILASRNEKKLQEVKEIIFQENITTPERTSIHIIPVNLSSKSQCSYLIEESLHTLPDDNQKIDFLILNHITSSRFGFWLTDNQALIERENYDFVPEMFATNTFSYIYLSTFAFDYLERCNGQIVVISSLAGNVAPPKTAIYASTKHAINGFFNSLRIELSLMRSNNVGITIAHLGAHDTEGVTKEVRQGVNQNLVKWEETRPAAIAILKAALYKKREIYQPHMLVYPLVALKPFFPQLIDYMFSLVYQ